MKRKSRAAKLPPAQRKNIKALIKNQSEMSKLVYGLHKTYNRRHALVRRVLGEVERNPSLYRHVKGKGRARRVLPMTAETARALKREYQKAIQPLAISGPGCDSPPVCPPMQWCVCIFSVGNLCCYACLSPDVIQC